MSVPKTETIISWTSPGTLRALADRIADKPTGQTFLWDDERAPVEDAAAQASYALRAAADALHRYHEAFFAARCMR